MTCNEDAVWRCYKVRKRRGEFHYDEFGQSPYFRLAQTFRISTRYARMIIDERRGPYQPTHFETCEVCI